MNAKPFDRDGGTLVGILIVITVMGLLSAVLLTLFGTGLLDATETSDASAAFQAAETGLDIAKADIVTDSTWYASTPYTITGVIGRAAFSATVTAPSPPAGIIRCVGRKDNAQWTSVWGGTGAYQRARVAYREDLQFQPRTRTYSQFRLLSGEQNATSVASNPQWQRLVASRRTNQFLLLAQNDLRQVYAQACTTGTWSSATQLNLSGLVPAAANRGFDVAYEALSGTGMVVYSNGSITPRYRRWTGSAWTAEAAINIGAAAGSSIRWIRLVPSPDSNQILLLVRWVNGRNYSSAMIWNGAAWANLQALEANCASEINYETVDGAFLSRTGMVVYINGANAAARRIPKYKRWNGAAWSAQDSLPQLPVMNTQPRWIRSEFNSRSNDCFVAILDNTTRLNGTHWTGTAWSAYTSFGVANGVLLDTSTYRAFDLAWGRQTNALMVLYAQASATYRSYMIQPQGGAATYGSTADTASLGRWLILRDDPSKPEFIYMGLDSANDVNLQRWDGSAWSLVAELGTASSVSYNSIDAAFRADSSLP